MAGTWSGRKVTNARAYWRPRLPLPCWRCGRMVVHDPNKPHGGWTVGHLIDRALGGSDAISNTWPECSRCNFGAGGKAGARITNARRAAPRQDDARARGLRGP